MTRDFTHQLLNTFIPTLILLSFGYSTLLIDISNFSDRFIGAGTSLLVMATLFSAISSDLPRTSYMKLIDIWFLWHNISILAMIFCHIILNRLHAYVERLCNDDVIEFEESSDMTSTRLGRIEILQQLNNVIIMVFPILNVLFYGIYFHFTLY